MPDQQAVAMHILLNGEPRDLVGPLSVAALLDELGLDGRTVRRRISDVRPHYRELFVRGGRTKKRYF